MGKFNKKYIQKIIQNFFEFRVEKFEDINQNFIPFFINYPTCAFLTSKCCRTKLLDFQDFCKVANLMEQKAHVTIEGLNQIRLIKKRY